MFICFYFIRRIGKKINFKIINYFDSISYEVYLVHYMFIVGPIGLVNITFNNLINYFIILIVGLILVNILYKIANSVMNIIESKVNIISGINNYDTLKN